MAGWTVVPQQSDTSAWKPVIPAAPHDPMSLEGVPGADPGMAQPGASGRTAPPPIAKVASPLTAAKEFGKGFVETIPSMVAHPVNTLSAAGQPITASGTGMYPATAPLGGSDPGINAQHEVQNEAQQGQAQAAQAIKDNPAYAAGGATSLIAAGELLPKTLPTISRFGRVVREAAMEPNAAALRVQGIGPKSSDADSAIAAHKGAAPYLQGASDLEDLKARIPKAKNEVWAPYKETVDAIGDKKVQGPDGQTTVGDLEKERLKISANLRTLKSGGPEAIQLATQKGMNQADLLAREKAIQGALDPHLEAAGINPKLIRQTFGQVSQVGENVFGRSTLIEKSRPFGLGRAANLSVKNPLAAPAEVIGGVRDIAAGRPAFSGKPTDIAVREAFRTGGAKPDLGAFKPAPIPKQLPAPGIPDAEYQIGGGGEGRTLPQPPATPPASPSVITPAPDAQPQLPAQAGPEGQGVPPAQPSTAPPPVNPGTAAQSTRPPLAPNPQPTPPGRTVVTPEGTAIPQRPQLPAPIKAPKSGVSLKMGDEITSSGKKGTVAGFNPKTGKVVIKWQ